MGEEEVGKRIIEKIERILSTIVEDVSNSRSPYFEVRKPSNNYRLKKIEFHSLTSQRRFTIIISVMEKCYQLITTGLSQNKRDIFYENIPLYRTQYRLDEAIMTLTSILKVERWDLNIEASAKGLIAGPLKWKDFNDEMIQINSRIPVLIPSHQKGFHNFESEAKFILVVEKDAVFKKIMEENCFEVLGPFILVTGKGYPDYATRRMLHKLWVNLKIPVFILVDADPHGLTIAATYRWGTKDLVDPEMTISGIQLLGVLPSELSLVAATKQRMEVSGTEMKRLDSLEKRMHDETWKEEVRQLRETRQKAEIETLTLDSPNYLTHVYLSSKISKLMASTTMQSFHLENI